MRAKRVIAVMIAIYLAFLIEFVLYSTVGPWARPDLMLLGIIFCDLYWGIRWSLWAAAVAGVIKGAFGIAPFGTYVVIYIAASYTSLLIRRNFYQAGSPLARAALVFLVILAVFVVELLAHMRLFEARVMEAVRYILLPKVLFTMLVVTFVFDRLRAAVLRLKL